MHFQHIPDFSRNGVSGMRAYRAGVKVSRPNQIVIHSFRRIGSYGNSGRRRGIGSHSVASVHRYAHQPVSGFDPWCGYGVHGG